MKNWFSQLFEKTPEQGRNAVRLAIVFMAAAFLAVLVFAFVAVQTGAWQAYAVIAAFVGFFIMEGLVVKFAQRNRADAAGTLLIAAVCFIVLAMSTLMAGIGLGLSIALALVILEIVFETLSGPLATRVRLSGFAFSIGIFLMDKFVPWNRPSIPLVQFAIPIIAAGTVLTIAFLMIGRLVNWRDLPLARKLLAAFSVLATLALVVGVVSNVGLRRVQNSYNTALAEGEQMESISLHIRGDLSKARGLEKDFLLHWRELGYDTAHETYIVPHTEVMGEIREHVEQLPEFAPAIARELQSTYPVSQFETELALIHKDLDEYEKDMKLVLQVIQERGFQDIGLEGELRDAAHNIEDSILDREGLDALVITMLQMRRHEKDYLLRGDQNYIDEVHQSVGDLKQQIASSDLLSSTEKTELRTQADQYQVAFDALVAKDLELAAITDELEAVELTMVPLMDDFASAGKQLATIEITSAQTNSSQTLLYSSITLIAALLVAIILSVTLSRQITRPVIQLISAAHELEIGNYNTHTEVTSGDELGTLGSAFNTMASRLKEAIALVTKRAIELQSVAEIATRASQSTNVQEMLQTVVDLTKSRYNLYHTHIYLLNDDKTKLVLAAGAGEPGRQMVSEKRTIALDHPHSLVARAARTSQGAISNDVTKEPDFLPNPLLPFTKAEMAIPIVIADKVLGVLDVQADYVDRFTDEDIAIKTTLAQQVAASLESLRQFQVSQKVARELAVVANISTSTATITEVDRLLQEVVDQTKTAFNLYHAHVYLLDEAGNTLVLTAGAGAVGRQMVAEGRQIPLDSEKSLVARAARTKAGTVVNDVRSEPDFLPNPLLPETRSEQAVPMIVGDKVLGVLDVQSEQMNRFTEIDVNIKTTLAAQIAVALQNARTFAQMQSQAQREAMLNTIGQKIQSATTVDAVLQIAARELGRALSAPMTIAQLGMGAKEKTPVNGNGNGNGNSH